MYQLFSTAESRHLYNLGLAVFFLLPCAEEGLVSFYILNLCFQSRPSNPARLLLMLSALTTLW